MPSRDDDFRAEMDLDALVRAKDIEMDRTRLNQAREMAGRRADQFGEMARKLRSKNLGMNNTVRRGGKMFGGDR